jgi:type IV pilus assembly protein PilC
MPFFEYIALDARGLERTGQVEAPDARIAAAMLRRQALFVVQLRAERSPATAAATGWWRRGVGGQMGGLLGLLRPVRTRDRIFFLQQLSLMLRSGLTIIQALETAQQQTNKPRLAGALGRLVERIRSGKSFSQALMLEPRLFPPLIIKLIESAEASGQMDAVCDRMAAHFEQKLAVRQAMLTALIYPFIVVLVSIGVFIFLVVKVIPVFAKYFASRQAALPWSTQFLMDASGVLVQYGPVIVLAVMGVAAGIVLLYRSPRGRLALDRVALMIPVVGQILTTGAMVQFSRTLAMLLHSGVVILESLRIVRGVITNRAISACFDRAAESVLSGRDLASSLEHRVIPALVPRVVAVGERTGALGQILDELGTFYERDLQTWIKRLSALIEPVLIATIGLMVGFVYYAFFQAVFGLATAGR